MSEPSLWPHAAQPGAAGAEDYRGWVQAWTIAVDALARVSVAAAAATAEDQLRADSASALAGPFADWAFVDLVGRPPARAVAGRHPDPALAALLAEVTADECPLIRSAMQRCAPVVTATADEDESLLGTLPSGRRVIGVLGARSAAAAPIVSEGTARGAVTIVRSPGRPGIGFVELGVLSQIGDLINAAVNRLSRA